MTPSQNDIPSSAGSTSSMHFFPGDCKCYWYLFLVLLATAALICVEKTQLVRQRKSEVSEVRAAIDKALTVEKSADRLAQLEKIGREVLTSEIEEALSMSSQMRNLRERLTLENVLVRRWAEREPEAALRYLLSLPAGRSRTDLIAFAAGKLSALPPSRSVALLNELPLGAARPLAVSAFVEAWAQDDPAGAFNWARTLQRNKDQEAALDSVWSRWPQRDPISAAYNIESVADPEKRRSLMITIGREWGGLDPAAAIRWAGRLPAGAPIPEIMREISVAWADEDPRAAANFAIELLASNGAVDSQAVSAVIDRWVIQDPRSTAEWLGGVQDRQIVANGITQIMRFWAAENPREAAQWLSNMPTRTPEEQDLRLHASNCYLDVVPTVAPDLAAKVALRFTSMPARPTVLAKCLSQWIEIDPGSAQRWILETGLPRALLTGQGRDAYLKYSACCNTPEALAVAVFLEKVAAVQTSAAGL